MAWGERISDGNFHIFLFYMDSYWSRRFGGQGGDAINV